MSVLDRFYVVCDDPVNSEEYAVTALFGMLCQCQRILEVLQVFGGESVWDLPRVPQWRSEILMNCLWEVC